MPNIPISIVTPSFNQGQFIEQTILSVLEQNYEPLEYIIIDGGSTDGTLEILKRYEDRLRWVSEPDEGQADAINKGFRMSSGEILGWLNADDLYIPGAISTVAKYFLNRPDVDFIYGDALAIDQHSQSYGIRTHVKQVDSDLLINVGDYLVQPAAFWRRELWTTMGELDETLHYALDYEYWMRVSKHYHLLYIPVCLAKERLYGSAKTFSGSLQRLEEIEKISKRHGGSGLPTGFHAEAASAFAIKAIHLLASGRWQSASEHIKKAFTYRPPLILFLRYFFVMFLFGYNGISRIWLYLLRFRQDRKRETIFP